MMKFECVSGHKFTPAECGSGRCPVCGTTHIMESEDSVRPPKEIRKHAKERDNGTRSKSR